MFIRAESTFDTGTFRQALGRFPTGVCVLTSVVEGVPLGMTVSSFNSLSLNPPLVLFSIDGRAGSLRSWAKAEGYALNVLAESQREVSERFAKSRSNRWEGTSYANGLFGAPVLPGIAALFECAAESTREVGDHVLFIGAVKRFRTFADRLPLVFHGGQYGKIRCSQSSSHEPQRSGDGLCLRGERADGRRARGGAMGEVEQQESRSAASG
jgi:flavin reductase (DIM6/NTAB) family NADH-FMN oxidoreductase RutF